MPISKSLTSCIALLASQGLTVATAESCTGGRLAYEWIRTEGASRWFRGSIVAYHNDLKEDLLGIPPETIDTYGVVSPQVVSVMAQRVRVQFKADFGIATSGYIGTSGGDSKAPCGMVCIAFTSPNKTSTQTLTGWDLPDRSLAIRSLTETIFQEFLQFLQEIESSL